MTELLKRAGYRTGHVGKWHIGPETKAGTYGLDKIDGVEAGVRASKRASESERGRDSPIFDAAIKFIEENKDEPFYLNVWGHISHNPINPSDALVAKWQDLKVDHDAFPAPMREKFTAVESAHGNVSEGMRRYLAEIEALDADVGRLLKRLDDLGLSENTIVVFSSDQGADMTKADSGGLRFNQMGFNGPHRGGKHTFFDGGQRVPFIIRWPGKVRLETSITQPC